MSHQNELVDELAASLRRAAGRPGRWIVGVAGEPGSGKSTLTQLLADLLGPEMAVVVPMDGFHLSNSVLTELGRRDRKGATDTFDVNGYLALLSRLRERDEDVVYAPSYVRGLEEPIAASIAIPWQTPIILTEGNYLLAPDRRWSGVLKYLDEKWFIETPTELRRERLIQRHVNYGLSHAAAVAWADGTDAINARLVRDSRERADRIIDWS